MLKVQNIADWIDDAATHANDDIVPRLLPANSLVFIVGAPGTGKSWLALDILLAVSSGGKVAELHPVQRPGNVLYIAAEGAKRGLATRFNALARGKDVDYRTNPAAIRMMYRQGFHLLNRGHVDEVCTEIERSAASVLIIDTLHASWGGLENESHEWDTVMRVAIDPLLSTGATVVLAHHTRKGSTDPRGTSAMHASRDALLRLSRKGNRFLVDTELKDDLGVERFSIARPAHALQPDDAFSLNGIEAEHSSTSLAAPVTIDDRLERAVALVRERPGYYTKSSLFEAVKGKRQAMLNGIEGLVEAGRLRRESNKTLYPAAAAPPEP